MITSKNIIWSKGYLDNAYSRKHTEYGSNEEEIIEMIKNIATVVFIRMGSNNNIRDLNIFANNLDKLSKPCILITSDGDRSVPSSYNNDTCTRILNNPYILKWYTQNYDKSIIHTKLHHYPIGFDLHTPRWLINNSIFEKINYMISCRNVSNSYNGQNSRIKNKIFSDTHNSGSHPVRHKIGDIIKNNGIFELTKERKSFADIIKDYNKYLFVLSPRGNGLDCHRTWELFLAGAIIITITSSLDDMYIKNNLPVVILNNIDELKDISVDKLNEWYEIYISKTSINNIFPKLTYNYWINNYHT